MELIGKQEPQGGAPWAADAVHGDGGPDYSMVFHAQMQRVRGVQWSRQGDDLTGV